MRSKKTVSIFAFFLMLTAVISLVSVTLAKTAVTAQGNMQPAAQNFDFSVIQITDTQNLCDEWVKGYEDYSLIEHYYNLTQWIADNAANYNVQMVIHTGDIINWPPDDAEQWAIASDCFMTLFNNNIPYCWCAGNHDQNPMDDPNGVCSAYQYPAFDVNVMRQKSYWVSDIFDAKNTAVQFSYNGYRFLVVDVEYNANASVIAWMRNLLDSNPDANIIVGTHDFIDWNNVPTSDWGRSFENILNQYPNVFLTLNGHNTLEGYPGSSHITVGTRTQTYFNLQESYDFMGGSTARLFQFSLATNTVQASTYQVFSKQWVNNSDYQFSFSFPFLRQQTTWHLTTNVSPSGAGTTNPSGTITVTGATSVTASPNPGYVFSSWRFDNNVLTENPVNIGPQAADSSHTLTAFFDKVLNVAVNVDRNRYSKWSYVNILASVTDELNHPLSNANVNLVVTDIYGKTVFAAGGVTDVSGRFSQVYKLVFDAQMGTYNVAVTASYTEFASKTGHASFFSIG